MDIDAKLEEFLKPLFGDMATLTIENQKKSLGFSGEMSEDQYLDLAEEIKDLCEGMAGSLIAQKIYEGLVSIIEEEAEAKEA